MDLHWLSAIEWRRLIDEAGFDVAGLYGWFDRRPFKGDEDMIWICRRLGLRRRCEARCEAYGRDPPWDGAEGRSDASSACSAPM